MYDNKFRDRVVRSGLALPFTLLISAVVWLLPGNDRGAFLPVTIGWGTSLATTYLVMEWANTNALLRIRSRLVTATFLMMLSACPLLHTWDTTMLAAPCLVLTYIFLFRAYQKPHAQADVFHAFLFIGIAGIFLPETLLLTPVLYTSLSLQLRALTVRTFAAGLAGILTPYWLWFAFSFWHGTSAEMASRLLADFSFSAPDYSDLKLPQMLSAAFYALYALMASFHFIRTSFNDKIRTRMFLYVLLVQEMTLAAFLLLFPSSFDAILRLFIVCSAPLVAHYFALARGKAINIFFITTLLALAALCAYNHFYLWTH